MADRLVRISSTLLLAAVLALLAALLVARFTGHAVLIDRSDSMRPAIAAGDLLLVRTVPPARVHPGDVVTFADPDQRARTITHRVIERHPTRAGYAFVTRGDANTGEERWSIRSNGTVGRLMLVMPQAGRVVSWLGQPWVRFTFVTLAGALLGGLLIRRIWS